jgi:hypothetical protein
MAGTGRQPTFRTTFVVVAARLRVKLAPRPGDLEFGLTPVGKPNPTRTGVDR